MLCPSRSLWRRALQVRVSQNNTRNCKTKTKTDFVGPQTGLVLRPTVSDHITGLGNFIFTYTLASIVLFTARNSDVTKRDIRYVCCPSPKWPTVSSGTLNSTVPIPYVVLVISDKFQLRHSGIHSLNVDWHLYRQWWADFLRFFCDFLSNHVPRSNRSNILWNQYDPTDIRWRNGLENLTQYLEHNLW